MNYIQYMKPGNKFWALPNGQEDVSWSEFWSNWKEAIVKAKEQIVDNWENLKQDYKDAADPIAASERKQAESIEATRAKQASMKFVSDNRADYEKKRDRKNFELKEFEQKQQLNKEATDAVMWTLTGPVYAVLHLASPNGVVKTYGNTKAAIQNRGGHYIEKAVASAAGDVLDATILAAPLFTSEARLARAMNKNTRNTLLPTIVQTTSTTPDNHIRIKVGDVEVNDPNLAYRQIGESVAREFPVTGRQVPTLAESGYGRERALKPTRIILGKVPFSNPMYAQGHLWYGLPQEGSTMTGLLTTNQPLLYANKSARLVLRKPIITSEDGLVTTVYDPSKGGIVGTRRIPLQDQLNSSNTSAYIYDPKYGYRIINTLQPKTSLAFFERKPAKISEAERLGIPKGIKYYTQEENLEFRNQINNFAKKYGYEPIGDEVTDPEVLERYARSLIKRHNTFYRGVELNPKESNLSLEYMATHAPGGGAGELYITPYLSVAAMYGEPVEILRPYKLGADRTRWFDEGDFQIYTAGGRRDMHLWEDKKGIAAPWLTSEEFKGKTSWVYKPHVETELTGRNLQFIPMSIQYRSKGRYPWSSTRVGSLAVPTTAFYKSGGTIHIKKKNKGKFTDYCGGKVTEECIRKGKNSSNPTTRKRANFAWVARHKFKHEEGGKINYLNIF